MGWHPSRTCHLLTGTLLFPGALHCRGHSANVRAARIAPNRPCALRPVRSSPLRRQTSGVPSLATRVTSSGRTNSTCRVLLSHCPGRSPYSPRSQHMPELNAAGQVRRRDHVLPPVGAAAPYNQPLRSRGRHDEVSARLKTYG